MPCTYYTPEEEATIARNEANKQNQEFTKARRELDKATRLLCQVISILQEEDPKLKVDKFGKEVAEWWKKHEAKDRARKAREEKKRATARAKARALNKLTIEEKKLLGLV